MAVTVPWARPVGAALSLRPTKSEILTDSGNFPTDLYVLAALADQRDVDLVVVEPEGTSMTVDQVRSTVLASISSSLATRSASARLFSSSYWVVRKSGAAPSAGDAIEVVDAAGRTAAEVDPDAIDEAMVSAHLTTAGLPDPDLLVRTGGEMRLSNFLLWQSAFAEFHFCSKYWPDFGEDDLETAIADFQHRERRFGGLSTNEAANATRQT